MPPMASMAVVLVVAIAFWAQMLIPDDSRFARRVQAMRNAMMSVIRR